MVVSDHGLGVRNERLRAAIHHSGLSYDEVAEHAGIDRKTLERSIAGRTPHPRNRNSIAAALGVHSTDIWPETDLADSPAPDRSGLVAAFASRSAFLAVYPPERLFADATDIDVAGLSNNLLCQHYADHDLEQLLCAGTRVTCLFLDPDGTATTAREAEEGYEPGHLARLTALNISLLRRLSARLPAEVQGGLRLAVYDQTIRFNIIAVSRGQERLAVVQPYLPHSRGVESPTLLVRPNRQPGLYETFRRVWDDLLVEARPC